MQHSDTFFATAAMMEYGGNFIKHLGQLWRYGDLENQRKLENAFKEYFEKYLEIAKAKGVHL